MNDFDAKLAEAEALWSQGPRTFKVGQVYGVVRDHAIKLKKDGLPVSRMLPVQAGGTVVHENGRKIKVHANGLRTDLSGRIIVDSKAARDRVCKVLGVESE